MFSCASKVHRASGSGRGKPLRLCILPVSLVFTPYFLNIVISGKTQCLFSGSHSRWYHSWAPVVPEKVVTDRHTQTKYCNLCCACAPMVNNTRGGIHFCLLHLNRSSYKCSVYGAICVTNILIFVQKVFSKGYPCIDRHTHR